MSEFKKVLCITGADECPYKKEHCCLCEVDANSVAQDKQLIIRQKCKVKNSRVVLGTTAA